MVVKLNRQTNPSIWLKQMADFVQNPLVACRRAPRTRLSARAVRTVPPFLGA
jgi:hypothetical protein